MKYELELKNLGPALDATTDIFITFTSEKETEKALCGTLEIITKDRLATTKRIGKQIWIPKSCINNGMWIIRNKVLECEIQ